MNLFYVRQLWPLSNSINLFRVHFDPIMRDYHSEEVDFGDSEATLLGFDKQVVIS